ncbi:PAS domain S-box protein [Nocardioides conyzicola]|uniref:histidine kinase n=1 Tax=Nocardioides conyzicola TaxID=1651781 RepID=A0ABP8WWQ9_9ACTN
MELHAGELFRGVFEAAPDAVVIVDDAGLIVLANAQCRTVFGCEPDALVGESVDVLVPLGVRGSHPKRRKGYGASANPRPMGLLRLAAVRHDGTEFPAEISLAPIDVDGHKFVSATVRDITARIKDEERFRALLDAAPDPMVIIDSSSTIVLVNNQVTEVFGYQPRDLVGQSITLLATEERRDSDGSWFAEYLQAPEPRPMQANAGADVRHQDGRSVPVEVSMSPLQTDEGVLVSVALRDVSERMRIEAESQRLRDDVIATVSHELRTPLTSIIGYAELMSDLDELDLSRRARKLLAVIERNASRELQLVNDLLTMAFLEDDRLRMVRESIDLRQVCDRVVEDQRLRARERGVALTFVGGEAPPVVGDYGRVVQVLENVVSNAVKFTRAGGRVDVGIADHGAMGVIEVRDTGIGVTPEEKERLFERLYRSPRAVAEQVQGAGLGLPIARAIVEAHGGWIDLQSELGVGTVVRVALPHERADATGA